MNKVKTKLHWLTKNAEQLQSIISKNKYSTVAKFNDLKTDWPNTAWSIVIDSFILIEKPNIMEANLTFLSPEGPEKVLYPGSKYELYEGRLLVALGEII